MPTQISVKSRRPMSNFRRRNRLGEHPLLYNPGNMGDNNNRRIYLGY